MSTSFPFRAIARAHRVPYGTVLLIADALTKPPSLRPSLNVWEAQAVDTYGHPILVKDIREAAIAEQKRRASI